MSRTRHPATPLRSPSAAVLLVLASSAVACATARAPSPGGAAAHAVSMPTRRAGLEAHPWAGPTAGVISLWVDSVPGLAGWSPELVTMAYEAARAWSTAGVPLRFERAFSADAADVRLHWNHNATWRGRGATRRTLNDVRETIAAECWVLLEVDGIVQTRAELRATVLHELGHALGLPHEANAWAIMFDGARFGGTPEAPTARDRAALVALYRDAPASTRSGSGLMVGFGTP
jgi:hypothetical protein